MEGYKTYVTSILTLFFVVSESLYPKLGHEDTTTCEQFSKHARFNPYSVLNDKWIVFYYWGPHMETVTYLFSVPSAVQREKIDRRLKAYATHSMNWTAPHMLMKDQNNQTSILIQRGDRGQFWIYPYLKKLKKNFTMDPADIRFKQTGDNKYIAFMYCAKQTAYVMSRLYEIPLQKHLQDVAARFGYRGQGGKSYLYQGHQWMPIPEADEKEFYPNKFRVIEGVKGEMEDS